MLLNLRVLTTPCEFSLIVNDININNYTLEENNIGLLLFKFKPGLIPNFTEYEFIKLEYNTYNILNIINKKKYDYILLIILSINKPIKLFNRFYITSITKNILESNHSYIGLFENKKVLQEYYLNNHYINFYCLVKSSLNINLNIYNKIFKFNNDNNYIKEIIIELFNNIDIVINEIENNIENNELINSSLLYINNINNYNLLMINFNRKNLNKDIENYKKIKKYYFALFIQMQPLLVE